MSHNIQWKSVVLITVGCLVTLLGCFAGAQVSPVLIVVGVLLSMASVFFLMRVGSNASQADANPPTEAQQRQQDFDQWQQAKTAELVAEADRLRDKASQLTRQAACFQEFLEYPVNQRSETAESVDCDVRLSEHDHEVHRVLEAEAERVYEAIRNNQYSVDGKVDIARIRNDAFDLIQRVAKVYSPHSDNPLLETSFEDVARAASRVCLHALVLLEQLPIDVKSYNINEMYGYIRKAVQSYGTYKQVAPWIKHITRGAYVGRFAAGANPVTLGAWWLATEVTRRGAQKFVEQAVDRQAVAALHDIVTVLGVEVANIYGPGFRQRDPAWIYGTELTEMMQRFPMSRESLSRGLQEITKLPLRSEYDRVYLYRCLAQKKAAGSRISDPAMLTRPEREAIASQLESFFTQTLHGVTDNDKADWKSDIESRLDLKLQLTEEPLLRPHHEASVDAVCSLHSFLVSVASIPSDAAVQLVESTDLMVKVNLEDRAALLSQLASVGPESRFEPPDLDPSTDQAKEFLTALFQCTVQSGRCDQEIEQLLLETASYFRRSRQEAIELLDKTFRARLAARTIPDSPTAKLSPHIVRAILDDLNDNETLAAVYDNICLKTGDKQTSVPASRLAVFQLSDADIRAILLSDDESVSTIWQSNPAVTTFRRKGYLIDDCEVSGGHWHSQESDCIVIAGSMTGGGYHKMFSFAGSPGGRWR